MPVLPPEPFVFPEILFEQTAPSEEKDGRWWVLRTRTRAEKALGRHLVARNLRYFLPQYQKRSRSNGQTVAAYHPLFAGYMFLHGDWHDRVRALETNLVAQVITVEDQQQLHLDLLRVHDLMKSNAALSPEDRLQPGMLVDIVAGPMMGMKGKIVTRRNKMRFLVEVRFIQQGVSVDVESWMIQPRQSLGATSRA